MGKIQAGIEIAREQDPAKAEDMKVWLGQVVASYSVLPMDAAAFRKRARLKHRKSDTLIEHAMIAAAASLHQLAVVTRNVGDFEALGQHVFDPFGKPRRHPEV